MIRAPHKKNNTSCNSGSHANSGSHKIEIKNVAYSSKKGRFFLPGGGAEYSEEAGAAAKKSKIVLPGGGARCVWVAELHSVATLYHRLVPCVHVGYSMLFLWGMPSTVVV